MKARTIIAAVAVAAVLGGAYAWKEYNRKPEGAAGMAEAHTVDAPQLLADFLADEPAATAKYVGSSAQAIKVKGVIRTIDEGDGTRMSVILDTGDPMAGIVCEFEPGSLPAGWKVGDKVFVKGICQGYTGDGMIPGDVLLQRCAAVE